MSKTVIPSNSITIPHFQKVLFNFSSSSIFNFFKVLFVRLSKRYMLRYISGKIEQNARVLALCQVRDKFPSKPGRGVIEAMQEWTDNSTTWKWVSITFLYTSLVSMHSNLLTAFHGS